MANKNKIIYNPSVNQEIKFIQTGKDTGGELLEMESKYNGPSKEPVAHYHPYQDEEFSVLEGALHVKINGTLKILKPGEKLHIPRNMVHAMWNQSEGITRVNWKVKPALNSEYFFETAAGLAADGKVNEKGMPAFLQMVLMINYFSNVFRLNRIPFMVQKVIFTLLAPIARLAGYRPIYGKYLD